MHTDFSTWQEFEEYTRNALDQAGYVVEFRKTFFTDLGKFQHDVVAYDAMRAICIDCKFYGQKRQRVHSLKEQAKIHELRTKEFAKIAKKRAIPVIVTSLDDQLLTSNGCIFVPIDKLNDFLINLPMYEEELSL